MHFELFHPCCPSPKGNIDEIFDTSFRIEAENRKFQLAFMGFVLKCNNR